MFWNNETLARLAHLQDWAEYLALQNDVIIAALPSHGGHRNRNEFSRLKARLKVSKAEIDAAVKAGGQSPLVHLIPAPAVKPVAKAKKKGK